MFQNLRDLDPTQPPLTFSLDPEIGLVIKADDVLQMIGATQSILAQQGIRLSLEDPENADKIVEAAILGCEAMDIIKKSAQSLFMEASLHG